MIRRGVEAGLRRIWRAPSRATTALAPLEGAFALALALRNRRRAAGRGRVERAAVPVISVGNIAVGGTGKTPFAGWAAARYERWGVRAGVVTNGYGPDEVVLHRRWNPDMPLTAGRRRARAVEAVVGQGAEVVILDDGFQHRSLARDLDLVLVAAEHPRAVHLLPRGRYREPERSLGRAGAVIVTRRTASFSQARSRLSELAARYGIPGVQVRLVPTGWSDVAGAPLSEPAASVVALSGIAGPRAFHRMLRKECPGLKIEPMIFPDHHDYARADLAAVSAKARGRPVVTTAKDAVKLAPLAESGVDVRVLHLRVEIESGRRWLDGALRAVSTGAALDARRMQAFAGRGVR